jgi:uncharacterized protein (TIGR03437 family)
MCQDATLCRRISGLLLAGLLLGVVCARAQSALPTPRSLLPDWRPLGNSAYEVNLASPATGPVERVWYGVDGSDLFIRTASGRYFATSDFETWRAANPVEPPELDASLASALPSLPEPQAQARAGDGFYARIFAFGKHVYRSDDGGRTWGNLTALRGDSIIGNGISDLAVSPLDTEAIVAVNGFGVWRSLDGGLTWCGLNETLPNLPVRQILSTPAGSEGTRLLLRSGLTVEWTPGERLFWRGFDDPDLAVAAAYRLALSYQFGESVTVLTSAGEFVYAGSGNGGLWVSRDRGANWRRALPPSSGSVESIFTNPGEPAVAFVALAGKTEGNREGSVLRTTDGGYNWDDLTGDLPAAHIWGVTYGSSGAAVYAATDAGVFLSAAGTSSTRLGEHWIPMTENLPRVPVRDVRLNESGYQIYVALDGYGVYSAPAPHRFLNVTVLNAADFGQRPAAPGSLLTVLGGTLLRAQAGLIQAPVWRSAQSEAQLQIPFDSSGSSTQLSLFFAEGRSTLSIPLREVSPAIFIDREGSAMLMDSETGVLLDSMTPAHSGTLVQVMATGLGRVRRPWPTGVPAPLDLPPSVIAPVRAYLNGAEVEVTRAILAPLYVGYYLVEIRLPSLVDAGPAELRIEAGGQESNRVRIHLAP